MHTVVNLSFLQKMLVIKNMYILNIKIRSTHMLNPNSKFLDIIKVPEFQKHYSDKDHSLNLVKVEKILKGSLISIPSPFKYYVMINCHFLTPPTHFFDDVIIQWSLFSNYEKKFIKSFSLCGTVYITTFFWTFWWS